MLRFSDRRWNSHCLTVSRVKEHATNDKAWILPLFPCVQNDELVP